MAVFGDWPPGGEPPLAALVEGWAADADLVVAEGFKREPFPRIEVFRQARHPEPVWRPDAPDAHRWLALVTDVPGRFADAAVAVVGLDDPDRSSRLADLVEATVSGLTPSGGRPPRGAS